MISREFVDWMASKPIRLIFMVFMVMTLTFAMVMTLGLHLYNAKLQERQIQQIERIEAEASRAKAEAVKARIRADENARDVKDLEKTIGEDH